MMVDHDLGQLRKEVGSSLLHPEKLV